jgi:hypothetical protein
MVEGLRGFAAYFAGDLQACIRMLSSAERRFREDAAGANAELGNVRVILCQALRQSGAYPAMCERLDALVRDAERRGDQYLKTTLHRSINLRFLVDDDVAGARAALAGAAWSPPAKGIHLQHWYELRAIAELGLYTGEIDHGDVAARMAAITGAPLMRIQSVRAEARWTRARVAIVFGGGDARAELAGLDREKHPLSEVWAALIRAALTDGDAAVEAYRRAVTLAEAKRIEGVALAARWRLGEVIGGDRGAAIIEEARAGLAALKVARPERLIDVLAPRRRRPAQLES